MIHLITILALIIGLVAYAIYTFFQHDTGEIEEFDCDHQCSGNCRRNGCNCVCGEFHEVTV